MVCSCSPTPEARTGKAAALGKLLHSSWRLAYTGVTGSTALPSYTAPDAVQSERCSAAGSWTLQAELPAAPSKPDLDYPMPCTPAVTQTVSRSSTLTQRLHLNLHTA